MMVSIPLLGIDTFRYLQVSVRIDTISKLLTSLVVVKTDSYHYQEVTVVDQKVTLFYKRPLLLTLGSHS